MAGKNGIQTRVDGQGQKEFLIIGHRGFPIDEPENTLPSFAAALDAGANAIETDLCMSSDGIIFLWHDWDPYHKTALARYNGIEPEVKYKPFRPPGEERKRVDEIPFELFRDQYGYMPKDGGEKTEVKIPSLDEFLDWAENQSSLRTVFFDIQLPSELSQLSEKFIDSFHSVISKYNLRFNFIIESVREDVLMKMKSIRPEYNYMLDISLPAGIVVSTKKFSTMRKAAEFRNAFGAIERPRPITLFPWSTYMRIVNQDIEAARREDRRLIAFTINETDEMCVLIKKGVSGIMTDRPDRLRGLLKEIEIT